MYLQCFFSNIAYANTLIVVFTNFLKQVPRSNVLNSCHNNTICAFWVYFAAGIWTILHEVLIFYVWVNIIHSFMNSQ